MTPETFTTRSLPPQEQLEAWRFWFDTVFSVQPLQPIVAGFPAESQNWNLDGLAISRVTAPAIRVTRTKPLIRRNPIDHWVITIGGRATTVQTDKLSLEAPAGVPFVLSLGNELVSERRQDQRLQFYLARDSSCPLLAVCEDCSLTGHGVSPAPRETWRQQSSQADLHIRCTPDLYCPLYQDKVATFFDVLLDRKFAGRPLMRHYLDYYRDIYWDLHLGAKVRPKTL